MRGFYLFFLSCALVGAQSASVEGTAVNASTGEPLAGVHIRLLTGLYENGVTGAYGAMSDRAGHFSAADLKAGLYLVMPERTGFVYLIPGSSTLPYQMLTLKAGEHKSDFRIEMTPRAVITGRVVDPHGDPVQGVMVDAEPLSKDAPRAAQFAGMPSRTDDRGEFRISGAPGKFHLRATPPGSRWGPAAIRTDGSAEPDYGATYYPNAAGSDRAVTVEAVAGREAPGIEIRLLPKGGVSISGVVFGPAGRAAALVSVRWGQGGQLNAMTQTIAGPDGTFTFRHLQPASYRLVATVSGGNRQLRSRPVDLRVESEVTGLRLELAPGSDLAGTVEVAEDPPGTPAEKRTVALHPTELGEMAPAPSAAVAPDGSFRLADVFPEEYRVTVEPPPENGYLKALALDGAAVRPGGLLDLSRGGSHLKITLSRNAAQISGSVTDKEGRILANSVAMVMLFDDPEHPGRGQQTRIDAEGHYSFKGVAPGKYRLMAVDVQTGNLNQEQLRKVLATMEAFEVHEGERMTRNVPTVRQEDVDGKPKP
jgi:hypothetical protein